MQLCTFSSGLTCCDMRIPTKAQSLHDNPGMVFHDGVVQVEPSEVHGRCTLAGFRHVHIHHIYVAHILQTYRKSTHTTTDLGIAGLNALQKSSILLS